MTRPLAPPLGPASLGAAALPDLVLAWRALLAAAGHSEDALTVLRLGSVLEQPDVRELLVALYPKLKSVRARARALALAIDVLPPESKPRDMGTTILELMAGLDE